MTLPSHHSQTQTQPPKQTRTLKWKTKQTHTHTHACLVWNQSLKPGATGKWEDYGTFGWVPIRFRAQREPGCSHDAEILRGKTVSGQLRPLVTGQSRNNPVWSKACQLWPARFQGMVKKWATHIHFYHLIFSYSFWQHRPLFWDYFFIYIYPRKLPHHRLFWWNFNSWFFLNGNISEN